MTDHLTKWLNAYDKEVEKYASLQWNDRAELNTLLKRLTIILSQLEHERSEAHTKHNEILFSFDGAVNRAIIQANHDVPELYLLRRIMDAGYEIVGAIRSNISSLNKEQ
jgi:hypothetical protein